MLCQEVHAYRGTSAYPWLSFYYTAQVGNVDFASCLVGSRSDCIGQCQVFAISTFSYDCCRRPGPDACKSQESLQQVVTHADLSSEVPITSKIYVTGMCCPSEVPIVRSALGNLQGVIKVSNEPAGIGCSHCMRVDTLFKSYKVLFASSCSHIVKNVCVE